MAERDPDFFKLHYRQWKQRMHKLRVPYDLQGALLDIVIETHLTSAAPADDDFVLAGILMVSPRKARAVVNKLLAIGLVNIEGGLVVDHTATEDAAERIELRAMRAQAGHEGGVRSGKVRRARAKLKEGYGGFASGKPLENNEHDEASPATTLELEKRREEKKGTPKPPKGGSGIDPDEFEEWYDYYPRKVARGTARRAFIKARKKIEQDEIVTAVIAYAAMVAGKDKEFIAHPATWLNGERWLDSDAVSGAPSQVSIEKRVDVAKDWLSRNDDIPTWMDSMETAEVLINEGYDYDKLRRAGFSLPPRGNVVEIAEALGA